MTISPHGTRVESAGGLPRTWRDRHGTLALSCDWAGGALQRAELRIPDGRRIELVPGAGEHPLLGPVDAIGLVGREPAGQVAEVDWLAPGHIPALDRPGALPSGAGTAVLNFLAARARDAGRDALRYRGPYPTGALFDSLLECFAVDGDLAGQFRRFSHGVDEASTTGEVLEPPVEFRPDPFERVWSGRVCAQLRHGLEKAYIDGQAYARDRAGSRRLRNGDGGWVATVELGGVRWAEVATLDRSGALTAGPHPLPPLPPAALDRPLPHGVRAAIASALPPRAPRLLSGELRRVLEEAPLVWGDAGTAPARSDGERIVVHAALIELLDDPAALLEAVAAGVEPVAQRVAQHRVSSRLEDHLGK